MHKRYLILVMVLAGSLVAEASPLPPALELKKVISFPLAGSSLPKTSDDLMSAITSGLAARVELSKQYQTVRMVGADYPSLDALTVDLTNAAIDSDRKVPKLKPKGPLEEGVHARQFHFIANPMKIDGADVHLDIQARDVQLGLQRDTAQTPILIFAAASEGNVQCDTTMRDISRIFRASANTRGSSYGLTVQRADLKLKSPDEHQLHADLRLASELWWVPISLHFTAKVEVNDSGEAKLSNLTCDGTDVAGWLISGFIRPSLAKYNGKTVPLVSFPTEQIKLHGIKVRIDGDDVHFNAAFGK